MLQGFRGEKGREGPPGPDGKPVSADPFLHHLLAFHYFILLSPESAYVVYVPQGKDGKPGDLGPVGLPGIKVKNQLQHP